MFVFIAGNLCLDFCNTEVVAKGAGVNLLNTNEDLTAWAKQAGFQLADEYVAPDNIEEALQLRKAIKNLIQAQLESAAPSQNDIDIVNAYFVPRPDSKQLTYSDGSFALIEKTEEASAAALFTQIVQSLMTLLVEEKAALKKCANPNCILHFVDKSRTQKRKWCSMEICGNRLKVSAHHKRSKT